MSDRWNDPKRWKHLGFSQNTLGPGMAVLVAVAGTSPPVIGYAVVLNEIEVQAGYWWLMVSTGGGTTLDQMYHESEILGVPAHGLLPRELAQ